MVNEPLLCVCAWVLQAVGGGSFFFNLLYPTGRASRAASSVLVTAVVGLGLHTVVGAVAQSASAMNSGATLTLLLMGVIANVSREVAIDPYA